jgi:tRNA dimethylallyltransferase
LYLDTIYKNYAMPEVAPDMAWRDEMMQQEQKQPGFLYNALLTIDPQEAHKHHPNSLRYVLRALEICTKT